MADAHEQGESSSGLRETVEKFEGEANKLVANDEVSMSEREAFELQKAELERQKKTFESQMIAFFIQKAKYESELRQIEEVRKRAFDAREKFFYTMEEDFMIYAERWMRFNHVHEMEIESRMWSAHKEMASRRVYYDGSKQLYSELDELKPLAFSLTEVALLPSVEEEFA